MEHTLELEQFIMERMRKTNLSAVSIALVKGDETIYQRGFGLANRELGIPATHRTNYCIGSITKSFTCLAIMQLQERGLLKIDDPVELYLPLTLEPHGEKIRIWHLMSHTSGIPALAYLENLLRYHHGASSKYLPVGSVEDMLSFVNGAAEWVHTKPGERWFYLNEGYILLGAIIQKISGKKYRDYVRDEILLPLGMTRSFHHRELFRADEDAAVPYVVDKDGRFMQKEYPWGQAEADGGLISNAPDMVRYMQMYCNNGALGITRVVTEDSIRAMASKVVRTPPENVHTGEPNSYYGYGLGTYDFFGRRMIAHSGSMYVATAGMRILTEEKMGAIALVNGSGYAPSTMADFALALALGEDPWKLPALQTEKVLESLVGTYATYQGTSEVSVKRKGDHLYVEMQNKYASDSTPLTPLSLDPQHPLFYSYASGSRQVVEFFVLGDRVEMINERYKYRRTGAAVS